MTEKRVTEIFTFLKGVQVSKQLISTLPTILDYRSCLAVSFFEEKVHFLK